MANAAEWSERVAAWRASKLTAAQFSAGRDFAPRTLLRWSSELRLAPHVPTIQVARVEPETAKTPVIRLARVVRERAPVEVPGAAIVILLGGARVEVGRGASREMLTMVLGTLTELSDGE